MQKLAKRSNKYMNDRFLRGNSMNLESNWWFTSQKIFQFHCYIMKDILRFLNKKSSLAFSSNRDLYLLDAETTTLLSN